MIRSLFKILSLLAWARAISKGPGAVGRRYARRKAYRAVGRLF